MTSRLCQLSKKSDLCLLLASKYCDKKNWAYFALPSIIPLRHVSCCALIWSKSGHCSCVLASKDPILFFLLGPRDFYNEYHNLYRLNFRSARKSCTTFSPVSQLHPVTPLLPPVAPCYTPLHLVTLYYSLLHPVTLPLRPVTTLLQPIIPLLPPIKTRKTLLYPLYNLLHPHYTLLHPCCTCLHPVTHLRYTLFHPHCNLLHPG